jgi:hypothetical protein
MERSLVEALEARKNAIIAALWANSNYDGEGEGKPSPRPQAIEQIEENYANAVQKIRRGRVEPEEDMRDDYGFFAAGERGLKKVLTPRNDEGKVADVVEEQKYEFDQH